MLLMAPVCIGVVATSTALLIAAGVAAATTAVTVSEAHQSGKSQKSAAEEAARTQERLFQESQQRFEGGAQSLLSQVPEPEVIKTQAKEEALKRRQRASQTIFTSPVGLINEPQTFRKTLLGQ